MPSSLLLCSACQDVSGTDEQSSNVPSDIFDYLEKMDRDEEESDEPVRAMWLSCDCHVMTRHEIVNVCFCRHKPCHLKSTKSIWRYYRKGFPKFLPSLPLLSSPSLLFIIYLTFSSPYRCIELEYPLLAEYDFRDDTHNPDIKYALMHKIYTYTLHCNLCVCVCVCVCVCAELT